MVWHDEGHSLLWGGGGIKHKSTAGVVFEVVLMLVV